MKQKYTQRRDLIAARKRAGLSRYALSKKTGLSESHLKAIEDGDIASPAYRVVVLISDALGKRPEDLFSSDLVRTA